MPTKTAKKKSKPRQIILYKPKALVQLLRRKDFQILFNLMDREVQVLRLYILKGLTFEHIEALLHVSNSRVQQIYNGGLKKIRKEIERAVEERKNREQG